MKQIQCYVLNIKIAAKQVCCYLFAEPMWPGHNGTTIFQIVLNTPQKSLVNQATQKYLPNFPTPPPPKKTLKSKISNPSIEIWSTPPWAT